MPFRPHALICFSTLMIGVLPSVALAQPPAGGEAGKTTKFEVPADIQKTMDSISDLDLLKALIPLKLTADQIQKLTTVMKEAVDAMESRRKEEFAAWRSIADDVAKAREDALNGVNVTPEVEAKILKAITESEKRSVAARQDAVARIFAVAREIFTPEQKDLIEQQTSKMLGGKKLVPPQYRNNPSRAPKEEVQNLMLQVFIERIFLFERTLLVLGKMKSADAPTEAPAAPPANGQ